MFEKIQSIKDERIKSARKLNRSHWRQEQRKLLLEGETIFQWALDANLTIEHAFVTPGFQSPKLLSALEARDIPCFLVSEGIQKKITDKSFVMPIVGVAHFPDPRSPRNLMQQDFVVVLDGVQDYGNIGTIVRTAGAFGIRQLWTTSADSDFFYRKTIEASRGKVFDVNFVKKPSPVAAITCLKEKGFQIVATSPHAPHLQSGVTLADKPVALVVGNETNGISTEMMAAADLMVKIPMSGAVESLNVGVATGISVYELKLKLVIAMLLNYIRSTFGREVNVVAKLMQQSLDAHLKKITKYSGIQVLFLMVLKCDGVTTLEHICRDWAILGDELTHFLEPLLSEGFIKYADGQTDTVELTRAGETLLGELWGEVEYAEDIALSGFSDDERNQFNDFLQRIQRNCVRLIEADN